MGEAPGPIRAGDDGVSDADLERALSEAPRGAFALASLTVGLLMAAWLAIYLFVFLPRGQVGCAMSDAAHHKIVASELRWGLVAFAVISIIMLAVIAAGVVMHINPPSNIEYSDPKGAASQRRVH